MKIYLSAGSSGYTCHQIGNTISCNPNPLPTWLDIVVWILFGLVVVSLVFVLWGCVHD